MGKKERNVLHESELADIVGGKGQYREAIRIGICNQCAIEGHMNSTLYKIDDMAFCRDVGHIYINDTYAYKNKHEIADIKCK